MQHSSLWWELRLVIIVSERNKCYSQVDEEGVYCHRLLNNTSWEHWRVMIQSGSFALLIY